MYTEAELKLLFNEWDRRYRADPESFEGHAPGEDYGEECVKYLGELRADLWPVSAAVRA